MTKNKHHLNIMSFLTLICVVAILGFLFFEHGKLIDNNSRTIYVVDIDNVYNQSQAAIKGREHLELVVKTLKDGFKQAEDIYGKNGKNPSDEIIKNGVFQIENQYKKELGKINEIVEVKLHDAINEWLLTNQNALIMTDQQLLGYGEKTDITQEIIKLMNKKEATYPALPRIFIEKPTE